jgi:ATP-dependent helicase/nuclease subunit A
MSPTAALTDQQARARDTRDVSVALAAGAGCGKTFVLTERFLSHLDPASADAPEPAQLHELIAITFTDAAAREMRLRIRAKCYERLTAAESEEDQDYWLGLLRAIETARVSTIHAFCTALLRQYAVQAGLDPTFGVLDAADADVLVSNVLDDVLRERLADQHDNTLELAATYGLGRLKQQLHELLKHRHYGLFEKWLGSTPERLVEAWQACYERDVLPAAVALISHEAPVTQIIELLASVEPPAKKQLFVEAKQMLRELLPKLRGDAVTADQLWQIHQWARVKSDGPFICTAKDWPDKESYDQYKSACEALRKLIDDHLPPSFDPNAARASAALGLALLRLADQVAEAYRQRKDALGRLDFDDQLALAYRLLTQHAAVRERLAGGLRLLLVDEFQDTDKLQVDLIRALCGDAPEAGKLFFVGDDKQSIYRFRRAEPENFLNLQSSVPESGKLSLTGNFRSQPAILHFVNALFCETFANYQPLRPHRPQTTTEPCVEFLWTLAPDKKGRHKGAAEQARRQESRWIARRLRQMIDECEELIVDPLTKRPRPVRLGDVAILFRALSDVQYYEEALRELELDYYLVGGHAFYSQQEIYDVLDLLRSVATPADEISLAGALRSPFFALADETLFWLVESAGSLNAGLQREPLPAELAPEERAKTAAAARTLAHLRSIKEAVPIATLLGEALARTGYDAALLAEFLGERKLANLHKLLEQARAADRGGELDLDGFITELAQFIADEPKEALAATRFESADVIRLMTIHHAKGLEFPLVVLPDLDRQQAWRPPPAALHAELGPLVPHANEDEKNSVAIGMTLYKCLEKIQDAEERKRLLYVATTRAADYLLLCSSLAAYDELQSDWMQLLADRFDLESGRFAGPLPAGYEPPRVRVTTTEPPVDLRPAGKSRGVDIVHALDEAHEMAERGAGLVPPEVTPVAVDLTARVQFSFSRLTGHLVRRDPTSFVVPAEELDPAAAPVDPRGLGSLVHAVLERVDLRNHDPLGAWCEQLAAEHVVENADAAAAAAREMLGRFAASSRWRQLVEAKVVHREVEFLLAWPPEDSDGRGRYLQGYIDCLYQDRAGGWHLVDYKTNHVAADQCPLEARQYEMQLSVYALAIERALGQAPVELALCFLRPGAEHVFRWDDAARQRCIGLVNDAMQSLGD